MIEDIRNVNTYILTVPTPIDKFKSPDLESFRKATKMIAQILKKGDFVIYKLTVYPGCTEEVCIPILENESSLIFNIDLTDGRL